MLLMSLAASQGAFSMIQLNDVKSCSDYIGSVQIEGSVSKEHFSLSRFEQFLPHIGFKVFTIGNPTVLVCRRSDCIFFVKSDGNFQISQVSSKERLMQIIHEIEKQIAASGKE